MLGREIVAHLRESILDDVWAPQLWSDAELLRFLNYAEVQACRRAHLIIDGTTATDKGTAATASTNGTAGTNGIRSLCWVPIVADQATYSLSPKILMIKRCQLASMSYPLQGPVTQSELDELYPNWFGTNGTVGTAGSGGVPICFTNEPNNSLTFILAPSSNDIARLVVSRIPLWPFTLDTSPEIDEQYHVDICDWAAHLAYSKPDSETLNFNLAKIYEDRFTAKFGSLPDAYVQKTRRIVSQKQRMRPREFGS